MLDDLADADIAADDVAALPERWTPDHVGQRLVDAFRTLDRLPRAKGPRQPGNHWPRTSLEWADKLAQAELPAAERIERDALRNALALRPSGREIDRNGPRPRLAARPARHRPPA